MKILKVKNIKYIFLNHHPTRHIKYKVINFAPDNKSIVANKVPSTNLEKFLIRIESPLNR